MSIKIPEAENDPKSKIRVCWRLCKTFLPPLHVQHVQTVQLSFSARVPPNLGSPTLEERFVLNRHSKRHLQFFDSFDSYKLPKWIQGKTRFFSSIFFSSRDSDVPLVPFTFQETPGMKASCISKKTNGWRDVNFLHVRMSKLTKVSQTTGSSLQGSEPSPLNGIHQKPSGFATQLQTKEVKCPRAKCGLSDYCSLAGRASLFCAASFSSSTFVQL